MKHLPGNTVSLRLSVACILALLPGLAAAGTQVTRGVDLVRGEFVAGRQPDGNSVILHGTQGLIVIDTGRHEAHTRRVLEVVDKSKQPVVAIVNTHWHLDHVGGNVLLRREFPQAQVYASSAIWNAMKGFLAQYRVQLVEMIAKSADDAAAAAPLKTELALLESGEPLFPSEIVRTAGQRFVAGRELLFGFEARAVTEGDVWLLDAITGTLIAGDLVTLPAPLFDTACPSRWQESLQWLSEAEFDRLIPGHGAPMNRREFATYRKAFDNLLACADSAQPKSACTDGWLADADALIEESDRELARSLVDYYLDAALRAPPERNAKLCGASGGTATASGVARVMQAPLGHAGTR